MRWSRGEAKIIGRASSPVLYRMLYRSISMLDCELYDTTFDTLALGSQVAERKLDRLYPAPAIRILYNNLFIRVFKITSNSDCPWIMCYRSPNRSRSFQIQSSVICANELSQY